MKPLLIIIDKERGITMKRKPLLAVIVALVVILIPNFAFGGTDCTDTDI